jgi:hypothetical protein
VRLPSASLLFPRLSEFPVFEEFTYLVELSRDFLNSGSRCAIAGSENARWTWTGGRAPCAFSITGRQETGQRTTDRIVGTP